MRREVARVYLKGVAKYRLTIVINRTHLELVELSGRESCQFVLAKECILR